MGEVQQGIQAMVGVGAFVALISIVSFIIFMVCTICNAVNIRKIAVNVEKIANRKRKKRRVTSTPKRLGFIYPSLFLYTYNIHLCSD